MKINEISPFKSNPIYKTAKRMKPNADYSGISDRFNSLEIELIRQGWKRIGKGAYGLVYEHPKFSYIFKIFYNLPVPLSINFLPPNAKYSFFALSISTQYLAYSSSSFFLSRIV